MLLVADKTDKSKGGGKGGRPKACQPKGDKQPEKQPKKEPEKEPEPRRSSRQHRPRGTGLDYFCYIH